jgi:hypothetical protein
MKTLTQSEILQLDIKNITELFISPEFINNRWGESLYVNTRNIKYLPPLIKIKHLHIEKTKIRKINYSKLIGLTIFDTRIKSIKMRLTMNDRGNKIKDCSYVGDRSKN